jgi:hypothetical protein
VTPALLLDLHAFFQDKPVGIRHTADLILGSYFFAMRACEFCITEKPGRTKRLTTDNITFRDGTGKILRIKL